MTAKNPMRPGRSTIAAIVALAAVAWGGCTSESPAPTGPGAPHDDGGSGAPPSFATSSDAGAAPSGKCQRKLDIGELTISNISCYVNEHVSNQSTLLQFPCAGGAATATFGSHVFTGTVTGNVVDLADVEPFVFRSCDWISTETIKGDLSTNTLTYSYSEKPKTTCPEEPCTADGNLAVNAGAVEVVK